MSITTEKAMTALIDLVDNVREDVVIASVSGHMINALEVSEDLISEYRNSEDEPQTLVDGDYVVENSVWLTVNNISVRVCKTDEGVVCDMWPLNQEDGEPLATTYAFYADGENNG